MIVEKRIVIGYMQVVDQVLNLCIGKWDAGGGRARGGRDLNGLDRAMSRIDCIGLDRTQCRRVCYAVVVMAVDVVW